MPLGPLGHDMVHHTFTHPFHVLHSLGKAARRFARCGVQMLQRGFARVALVKVDCAAQAHDAVGAVAAFDHQRYGCCFHFGDDIVVRAIQFGDVLRLL